MACATVVTLFAGCDETATVTVLPIPLVVDAPTRADREEQPAQPVPMVGVIRPAHEIELIAPSAGRVVDLRPGIGDTVIAGQPIARLEDPGLGEEDRLLDAARTAARAELRRAQVESNAAAIERQDTRRLVARGVSSRHELRQARLRSKQTAEASSIARARLDELDAKLESVRRRSSDATILAPWPGSIAARHVDPGASLAQGAPVVRLVSDETLVVFAVEPERAETLSAVPQLRVQSPDGSPIGVAEEIKLAPEVDPASGLRFASARLVENDSSGGVVPGQVVEIVMATSEVVQ